MLKWIVLLLVMALLNGKQTAKAPVKLKTVKQQTNQSRALEKLTRNLKSMKDPEIIQTLQNYRKLTGQVPAVSPVLIQRLLKAGYKKQLQELYNENRQLISKETFTEDEEPDWLKRIAGIGMGIVGLTKFRRPKYFNSLNKELKQDLNTEKIGYTIKLTIGNRLIKKLNQHITDCENFMNSMESDIMTKVNQMEAMVESMQNNLRKLKNKG